MELSPQILTAKVMHQRHFPRKNGFCYRVYYLALPLKALSHPSVTDHLAVNRSAFLSFHEKDHGSHDSMPLYEWLQTLLVQHELNKIVSYATLICMPRILGYVFNPVSFWMCYDQEDELRAVVCEVNNTFGETHRYICAHDDHRVINAQDWLIANKLFHVSPFLKREGQYHFRFAAQQKHIGIWIDYYDASHKKQLSTALTGTLQPLTRKALQRTFWTHPLVTFKTIILIHWQALKLVIKGIPYIVKPKQQKTTTSMTENMTKRS